MKKKKYKKKGIKKRDKQKEQERMQDVVDKEQVENQSEMKADGTDKEQRRTTRLGAIIAIVAVVGTLCGFLFKMTIRSLNVWSEQGIMYWYLQSHCLLALSTSVLIFIDIIFFLIGDLKRYDTKSFWCQTP